MWRYYGTVIGVHRVSAMRTLLAILSVSAGLCLAGSIGAGAVTIRQDTVTLPTAFANPLADDITGTVYENVVRTKRRVRLSPWLNTANHARGLYTAILRGSAATYDFGRTMTSLSLVWGSVDDYNRIVFYLNGKAVDRVAGDDLFPTAPQATGYTNVFLRTAGFDSVRFASTRNSFEYANLTAAVPVPAAGAFLLAAFAALGGLGLLGASRRRAVVRVTA
jgi:hypothetical protein